MKIKFLSITAAALLISSLAIAQGNEARYERSTWNPSPSLHSMPAAFKGQSAVYLLDSRVYHYKFEGKDLFQYNQVHKIVKVEDDNGIEMFNTIHIPVSSFAEVSEIKARVITSSGKVINVPPGKIKEEEEDGTRYKLFALEGIDKGSEVEYTYTVKRAPNFFGSEIFADCFVIILGQKVF